MGSDNGRNRKITLEPPHVLGRGSPLRCSPLARVRLEQVESFFASLEVHGRWVWVSSGHGPRPGCATDHLQRHLLGAEEHLLKTAGFG